jgi:hypothetical protein
MQALLLAVKAALQSGLAQVRAGDVFITPDLGFVPAGVKAQLAVGIKDGTVVYKEKTCGVVERTMPVHLRAFVRLQKSGEASVIGDAATGSFGVLAAGEAVKALLKDNLLGIAGMQAALPDQREPESTLFVGDGGVAWQTKDITINYIWEG